MNVLCWNNIYLLEHEMKDNDVFPYLVYNGKTYISFVDYALIFSVVVNKVNVVSEDDGTYIELVVPNETDFNSIAELADWDKISIRPAVYNFIIKIKITDLENENS